MVINEVRNWFLQWISLAVTWLFLTAIFAYYTGLIELYTFGMATITLFTAAATQYVGIYHQFSKPIYRKIAIVPASLSLLCVGFITLNSFYSSTSFQQFRGILEHGAVRLQPSIGLPEWWTALFLTPAALLVLIGSIRISDYSAYPKPPSIRSLSSSPVYFGLVSSIFGLWAVLFVGISIQRIIIIAPLFEELLKFGIALLLGSTLFGRSQTARIGIALVIGAMFGIIEHSTTYPMETDTLYLFRTAFHAMMTILSIKMYTLFESEKSISLQWIAPVYPVMLHFFFNTFNVLIAVISVSVFGSVNSIVPIIYGSAILILAAVLLVFSSVYPKAILAIHKPFQYVLSDAV